MSVSARRVIPGLRSIITAPGVASTRRCFSNTPLMKNTASTPPLPARKPVGAFRGGLFGFLTGSVAAGAVVYYYILGEYRISNNMLTEDINALQCATQKLQTYISELEARVDQLHKKK
ncbi:uncharacterized protein DSM5745_05403 [Aspergillus mulundensis]|uniref:Uncharacterized protein n=1 Tax=Aspergillus mulundensis TaxID=1810919 RepID=A0A3D8RXK7_9EURO|nr:Uncharacterized protein DSM5745_05403 [Aspergillus mulundensis]RDW78551.1 Uncharacterized protein DSM5745_05403 [Aspergillus mulundensis]